MLRGNRSAILHGGDRTEEGDSRVAQVAQVAHELTIGQAAEFRLQ